MYSKGHMGLCVKDVCYGKFLIIMNMPVQFAYGTIIVAVALFNASMLSIRRKFSLLKLYSLLLMLHLQANSGFSHSKSKLNLQFLQFLEI